MASDPVHAAALFPAGLGSPVGYALWLVHRGVTDRARSLVGESAFSTDDEGEEFLADDWAAAGSALMHAALAVGAPELLSPADRRSLPGRQR